MQHGDQEMGEQGPGDSKHVVLILRYTFGANIESKGTTTMGSLLELLLGFALLLGLLDFSLPNEERHTDRLVGLQISKYEREMNAYQFLLAGLNLRSRNEMR